MNRLIQLKTSTSTLVSTLLLAYFWLPPSTSAVVPAPDGGYLGGNTAEGENALFSLTGGTYNTAMGFFSLRSDTTGNFNTAIGAGTLLLNTGEENTATGAAALLSNTIGASNTANGAFAILSNTTGNFNTANGSQALQNNTTGSVNTANGANALFHNSTGASNTATGVSALFANTTGAQNTANGYLTLLSNSTGSNNTANGVQALYSNTTGDGNAVNGFQALYNNTEGIYNVANGFQALYSNTTGRFNVANGYKALYSNTEGYFNVAIGDSAGQDITGSSNVCIGTSVAGVAGVNNTTWIRNVYDSVATGRAVYVDSDYKVGTLSSSRRYKDEIRPMAKASEAILSLRPVSFRYKKEIDRTRSLSFGLIAEEVAEIDPRLVTPDRAGKPETVRYEIINAMLLNEFLKQHRKVEEQQTTITRLNSAVVQQQKDFQAAIAEQQRGMEAVTARLVEQAAQIQTVSVQLEAISPAPQTVLNNH
jgi:trimeric autotransporter adhesin